ncbi:unnamed protein product [Allacma fusca]|uniref:RING-type domain-containing protein n=1 Tax=Allacma fusca TaxID=39272 RepID=A0A8J2LQR8_9HEXA|nr:unnamed protein product [Allacma fusca]
MTLRESEYECPICFDELSTPIFQCYEGHLLCQICIEKVTTCPFCKEQIPPRRIRNREIEKVISLSTEKENHKRTKKHSSAVRDENVKHSRASSSRNNPQGLTIKIHEVRSVFSSTYRPAGFSPPTQTMFKHGLEIDGKASPHRSIITYGNNNNIPTYFPISDGIVERLSCPSGNSSRGFRPPHLSVALSDRQNLINFVDEVPPLPSPPPTDLLSFPIPPPLPPRKNRPSV